MEYLAIDCETHLIAQGLLAPPLVCLSWWDGKTGEVLAKAEAEKALKGWLLDPNIRFIAHNAAFDFAVFANQWPALAPLIWQAYDADRIFCTLVAQKLIKIAKGFSKYDPKAQKPPRYSLAACIQDWFGHDIEGKDDPTGWRLRFSELENKPVSAWPKAAVDYAQKDAGYAYLLCEKQSTEPLKTLYDQVRAAFALHLYACWGLRTDASAVEALEQELASSIDAQMGLLRSEGLYRDNGTKDLSEVRKRVDAAYSGNPPKTVKGSIQTSASVLKKSGDAILVKLASIAGDQKLLSTYVPVLKSGISHAVCPRWNVLVDSGRTSCARPNLQNLPRKGGVRECFVAREGSVFIACDYSLAELCSLAQILFNLYGQSAMADALRSGKELHLATAAAILGIDYDQAVSRSAAGDPKVKEARQIAKAQNFGLPGGLGAQKFSDFCQGLGLAHVDEELAHTLKAQWLAEYPEMRLYFQDIGVLTEGGEANHTHSITGYQRGNVNFTALCNHNFQHLTAHGAKLAIWEVSKRCYNDPTSALYGFHPVVFVHDEIIIEGPKDRAAAAAVELAAVMREEMAKILTDIPVRTDCTMMERWYKQAGPRYGKDGDLIPWTPEKENDSLRKVQRDPTSRRGDSSVLAVFARAKSAKTGLLVSDYR